MRGRLSAYKWFSFSRMSFRDAVDDAQMNPELLVLGRQLKASDFASDVCFSAHLWEKVSSVVSIACSEGWLIQIPCCDRKVSLLLTDGNFKLLFSSS